MYVMIFFRILFHLNVLTYSPRRGGLLLIAMYHAHSTYHFSSCKDSRAIPSVGTFVCPDIRGRRLNPSSSRRTAFRGACFAEQVKYFTLKIQAIIRAIQP